MLVIERKLLWFNIRDIYFSNYPFDVGGCDVANFLFCRNVADIKGFTHSNRLTAVIDLTQDLEKLWRNMNRNCRYGIRRAEREGLKISLNQHPDEFYQIYVNFKRSKGIRTLFDIDTPPIEIMEKYATLFTAEYQGEILAGNLYLEDKDTIMAWLSASKRLEVDKEKASLIGWGNRLLHWEAIKYAKERGRKEFDWGGLWQTEIASQDKSRGRINSFKLSYGGEVITRHSYKKVYSKSYRLGQCLYHPINRVLKKATQWR